MTPRARRWPALALIIAGLVAATSLLAAPAAQADAVRRGQWYLGPLGISKAWSLTKGNGVKIGILDSRVDATVPDLRGAVVAHRDFAGGRTSANGHGTNVAALAAARGHGNGDGVIGVAPQASVVSAGINFGAGGVAGNGDWGAATRWLVSQGVGVINMSVGTSDQSEIADLRSAIAYAQSKDVVVVASAGDVALGDVRLGVPASVPGVVAVTGVDRNLKRDPGATIGPGTAIAAPFSTDPTKPFAVRDTAKGLPIAVPRGDPNYPYSEGNGTSLSAPIVAGVVALIRARFPDLDAANVINKLIKTATPAGGPVPNPTYGYGVVNADRALTADVPTVSANPLGGTAGGRPSGSATTASPAPSSSAGSAGGRSARPAPSDSPSAVAGAGSHSSSGPGPGGWIAIIAGIVAALALLVALVARSRRPPAGARSTRGAPPGSPPWPGPSGLGSGPPPPGPRPPGPPPSPPPGRRQPG